MNDPWDVKSVRQSSQYLSCMKINGVPLLPPVLSKECRKEMQYYKLLAKEVEKRISVLKPYVIESDSDSSDDKTDAPELPESELSFELPQEGIRTDIDVNIEKIKAKTCEKLLENSLIGAPKSHPVVDEYDNIISHVATNSPENQSLNSNNHKFVIEPSLGINETGKHVLENVNSQHPQPIDLPERDYNSPKKITKKEIKSELDTLKNKSNQAIENIVEFSFNIDKDVFSDPFPVLPLNQDGPSSLSSKSFTGSLNDIHTDSMKVSHISPNLIRQRSYTLLKPSPQLLAHLEVQSQNTGVEMSCISMSESLSNLTSPSKKRRSWDLESAKVKWSSMALELNKKNVTNVPKVNGRNKSPVARLPAKKVSPPRAKSATQEKTRRNIVTTRTLPKSEPIQKIVKKSQSPVRNSSVTRTPAKEPISTKSTVQKKENIPPKSLISESEDPAARVRELYEKIQKQQLIQMASLVEKQKREQMLLQQVFEEQNNLLYKQLKTICPKSPIEVKEAWGDKTADAVEHGPVSLSQLISTKSPEQSAYDSPVSSTLTETNNYITKCDDVLKMSRDITGSIKKQQVQARPQNGSQSSKPQSDGSRTRTHSPATRNTSRKLMYDTSASSDREYDAMLTDRTNDTLADLNVTFPTDCTDDSRSYNGMVINHLCGTELAMVHNSTVPSNVTSCRSGDTTRSMEDTVQHSMKSMGRRCKPQVVDCQPTPQQRAAATKIVAHVKGYLVRRLMRTERVVSTVQTIRDALVCALQLHQDREGIRADVDLHRRLIQQITAACYSLHDTFVASTPAERCAMIAGDRSRRRSIAARQTPVPRHHRHSDIMSQSHSGVFPTRAKRPSSGSLMTQSNYETFSSNKCGSATRSRYIPSPRRRPWR
ncbi:LOW QUALITY PROTEIN: centriolar coiled coil protein 110kDa [Aphomia sociella]